MRMPGHGAPRTPHGHSPPCLGVVGPVDWIGSVALPTVCQLPLQVLTAFVVVVVAFLGVLKVENVRVCRNPKDLA